MTPAILPRLVLTPGEPAGIGPDLCVQLAQRAFPAQLVAIAAPDLLRDRARRLRLPLELLPYTPGIPPLAQRAGSLSILPLPMARLQPPGQLDPANAPYVLATLARACDGCLAGEFDALVTGPVHKGIINDAGIPFSGHTEFLAARCGAEPVMMLVAPGLRVALATTHLPLRLFGLPRPRLLVCGLNPHAGEGGHLGREERDIIAPLLDELRAAGLDLVGPVPADSAFVPEQLAKIDAVLAMYHDQGLPVLKHLGFGQAVNVTLGLPIIRVSVDHGTALELAGTGRADAGSLQSALDLALRMTASRSRPPG